MSAVRMGYCSRQMQQHTAENKTNGDKNEIRIHSHTEKQQDKESNYKELEVVTNAQNVEQKVTSVGMFAKLNANTNGVGAVVKNLTLNVAEVFQ